MSNLEYVLSNNGIRDFSISLYCCCRTVIICDCDVNKGDILTMDSVNHPEHYTQGGIECIDAMQAAFGKQSVMEFCLCNAFKYCFRCKHKNSQTEDVKKAVWYLNKWLELKED